MRENVKAILVNLYRRKGLDPVAASARAESDIERAIASLRTVKAPKGLAAWAIAFEELRRFVDAEEI